MCLEDPTSKTKNIEYSCVFFLQSLGLFSYYILTENRGIHEPAQK